MRISEGGGLGAVCIKSSLGESTFSERSVMVLRITRCLVSAVPGAYIGNTASLGPNHSNRGNIAIK